MGYFKNALKGVGWMMGLRGTTRLIALVKIAVLARLLGPVEFGIFGIALLVLAFLEIITETGINTILVQGEIDFDEYLNTAWIVSILRGLIIGLLIVIFALPVSFFFKSPESLRILFLICLVPILRGFINPSIIKFQKKLEFNKEFYFRFAIFIFDALVTIVLAFVLKSALSLVWGMLAGTVLEITLSMLLVSPRPKLEFEIDKFKKVLKRGKWLMFTGMFDYFFQQGDDIIVGRILSVYWLGLYQVAYKISTLPISEGAMVFHKVTFPIYVKIKGNKDRLKRAYLKIVLATSVLVIPFGLLVLIFSPWLVNFFLGTDWLAIVPVLKILVIYGVVRAIFGTSSPLFLAIKKQEYNSAVTFTALVGLGITIIPLVKNFGIYGAGLSALFGWMLTLPLILYFLSRVFRVDKK